jgi:hypothetical protein
MKFKGKWWKGFALCIAMLLVLGNTVGANERACNHGHGYSQGTVVDHYTYDHQVKVSESQGYQTCHVLVEVTDIGFFCPDCGFYTHLDTVYDYHHSIAH